MIESHELRYPTTKEEYKSKEKVTKDAPAPPKKVSFLQRFFIHKNDNLIKMTAALPLDHSFPGNHFNLR